MYVLHLTPNDRRDARHIVRAALKRGGSLYELRQHYGTLAAVALGTEDGTTEAMFWARCYALVERLTQVQHAAKYGPIVRDAD